MADYILRDDAIQCANDLAEDFAGERLDSASHGAQAVAEWLKDIPAADVRTVDEISDSADEAIAYLNSVHNQMPYHVYSALFDLIYAILPTCDTDMMEANHGSP